MNETEPNFEPPNGWQQTKNGEYLSLVEERLRRVDLTWVGQFLDILEAEFETLENARINDIGCQAFQFYKGMKARDLRCQYFGYDIEPAYLEIGLATFPELSDRFALADIQEEVPRACDISVMSATLEHLDNYRTALRYLLSVTEKFCLLRTFLAETTRKDDVHQVGAPASYPVYEFSSDELRQIFSEEGFDIETGTDRYTGSQPKDISSDLVEANIVRTQFVIMARRRAK